jgi:hypothetical protein
MQASQLSDQLQLRHLETENQNLKRLYEEEVAKNTNLMVKVKSIETSQSFAEKYVFFPSERDIFFSFRLFRSSAASFFFLFRRRCVICVWFPGMCQGEVVYIYG